MTNPEMLEFRMNVVRDSIERIGDVSNGNLYNLSGLLLAEPFLKEASLVRDAASKLEEAMALLGRASEELQARMNEEGK